jgi:hypothetical protein
MSADVKAELLKAGQALASLPENSHFIVSQAIGEADIHLATCSNVITSDSDAIVYQTAENVYYTRFNYRGGSFLTLAKVNRTQISTAAFPSHPSKLILSLFQRS